MYVGHSLLAFALGALVARRAGVRRSYVLPLGLLAAGFALLPDVDTAYTVYAVLQAGPQRLFPTPEYVWTAEAWRVHRALTHSVLVGAVASLGAAGLGLAATRRRSSPPAAFGGLALGVGGFAAILAAGFLAEGAAGLTTAGLYVAGALALVAWAVHRGLPTRWLGVSAAVGLLTHPFGDLFMGRPPAFLFPLTSAPPIPKLAVAGDPTVNLVALFGLELALAWAVVWTVSRERGFRVADAVAPHAVLAVGFAGAALLIRPPTLQVAYHFALGTIATGVVVGAVPGMVGRLGGPERRQPTTRTGVVTALAGVSFAVVGYLLAYLAVGA